MDGAKMLNITTNCQAQIRVTWNEDPIPSNLPGKKKFRRSQNHNSSLSSLQQYDIIHGPKPHNGHRS